MKKEMSMVSLFEQFLADTYKGKRRKLTGERILPQSAKNYGNVLSLLKAYEAYVGNPLMLKTGINRNTRQLLAQRKQWKNFYRKLSDYLFYERNCFDNYAGTIFKILKCFFRYIRNEKMIPINEFYESFYVRKENVRIITLLPERLYFLIANEAFKKMLFPRLNRCREAFIFGCTTALRFSDLMNLKVRDVEKRGDSYFLYYRSLKTDTPAYVKLPPFAVEIFNKHARGKTATSRVFPRISVGRFNTNIRNLGTLAGWTEPIGKFRSKDGEQIEIKIPECRKGGIRLSKKMAASNDVTDALAARKKNFKGEKLFRFCDLMTSHVMRRTGITVLLMLGMPEILVRKISGHTANSKSFFRYVDYAQSFITDEIEKAHGKLMSQFV